MEQMGTFMAEYAEWFYMGSSIVILILLILIDEIIFLDSIIIKK